MLSGEQNRRIKSIAPDPRLGAALWLNNPGLAEPLMAVATERSDLWSSSIVLNQPRAAQWLGRVLSQAANNEVAAAAALTLQPSADDQLNHLWIRRLCTGQPRSAYLAARWTRFTWPLTAWQNLRNQLRESVTGDLGPFSFHWHRDIQEIDVALRHENVGLLWMAEWGGSQAILVRRWGGK